MDDDRQLSLPLPECTQFVSSTKSIDRNMKIKVKFSNSKTEPQSQSEQLEVEEDAEEEQEQEQKAQELLLRVCDFCGKRFSSGKALGGHRRIHLQDRDPIHKSSKARPPATGEDQTKQTCCICGKTFPSEKSLFGHMRFHPERSWRGVKPPEPAAAAVLNINININSNNNKHASSSSSTIENHEPVVAVDLMESLAGWTVTNRRGKRSTYKEPEDEDESDNDYQMLIDDHAVHNLLFLACAETQKGKTKNFEQDNDEQLPLKKHKLEFDDEDEEEEEEEGEISDKKKRFRCGTCNKSFQTFQALGGHRSSHNKITNESTDQHNCSIGGAEIENVHRCKICNKSFASGQALGGHQRCHWAGPSSASASASASEVALGGQRSFVIDLNQPPPPQLEEEEEEEEEAGVESAFNPVPLH